MLEGTLDLTLDDGRVKRLKAGEALAEVVNRSHNGRNVGSSPVKPGRVLCGGHRHTSIGGGKGVPPCADNDGRLRLQRTQRIGWPSLA
jgi:hypothetical protein